MVAGGGIPEIKGYLNGVRVVGALNLKTFVGIWKLVNSIQEKQSLLSSVTHRAYLLDPKGQWFT